MKIVRVEQVLASSGIAPPAISALVPDVSNYFVLLAQPKGVIETSSLGVRNRDREKAHRCFSRFIDKAVETEAHFAVTPEYSLPWNTLVEALRNGRAPNPGKLWVFGCESITLDELNAIKAQLAPAAEVLFEPLNAEGAKFLDPLTYIFVSEDAATRVRRLVLLVQRPTRWAIRVILKLHICSAEPRYINSEMRRSD
jgi:hypothetical protein